MAAVRPIDEFTLFSKQMSSSATIAPAEFALPVPGPTKSHVPDSPAPINTCCSEPSLEHVESSAARQASDRPALTRKHSHLHLGLGSSSSAILSHRHSSFVPATKPLPLDHNFTAGFFDVFGYLGVLMVIAFLLSSLALIFLAFVQIFPDEIGNAILNTQSLDNGDFLMFSQASFWLVAISSTTLLLFSSGYAALIAVMLWFRSPRLLQMVSRPSRTASIGNRVLARFISRSQLMRWVPYLRSVRPSEISAARKADRIHILQRVGTVRRHLASRLIFEFTSIEGQFHEYHVSFALFC